MKYKRDGLAVSFLLRKRGRKGSNEDKREAYMGSRGEVPCQGLGDEIPNVPVREAPVGGNRRGAEGDNYDSDTL